jgi:hypothetical protein
MFCLVNIKTHTTRSQYQASRLHPQISSRHDNLQHALVHEQEAHGLRDDNIYLQVFNGDFNSGDER